MAKYIFLQDFKITGSTNNNQESFIAPIFTFKKGDIIDVIENGNTSCQPPMVGCTFPTLRYANSTGNVNIPFFDSSAEGQIVNKVPDSAISTDVINTVNNAVSEVKRKHGLGTIIALIIIILIILGLLGKI